MPKRTNDFQELIALIEHQLQSGDAKITTSKMLTDELADEEHEVDIVIEAHVGIHPVTLAIECIDHSRPADRSWVQKMDGKHRDTDAQLILVSRSGYTPNAKKLAAKRGIPTLTLDEASRANWKSFVDEITDIHLDNRNVRPLQARVHWADPNVPLEDRRDYIFRDAAGNEATLSEFVDQMLQSDQFREALFAVDPSDGHTHLAINVHLSPDLQAVAASGRSHYIDIITIVAKHDHQAGSVPFQVAGYGSARVAVCSADRLSARLTLAMVERPGEEPTVAMSMRRAKPNEKKLVPRKRRQ